MACIIDIRHWLDEDGNPVPKLRRRVLRLARLIEYDGSLVKDAAKPTLVECQRRQGRPPYPGYPGLLWVVKTRMIVSPPVVRGAGMSRPCINE